MKDKATFNSPLADYMEMHLEKCRRELGESSCTARERHLLDFDRFLVSRSWQTGDPLDEKTMTEWLSGHAPLSGSTIMTYSNSIRMFLRFYSAMTGEHVFIPPLYKARNDYVPHIYSDDEMDAIYELVDNYPYGLSLTLPYIHLEFPTVIRLLEAGGFRLNELITARMAQVDLENGTIKMINTKGMKERYVPLSEPAADLLRQYCRAMKLEDCPDACLFPRRNLREPLCKSDIENRFRKVLVKAGIRPSTPSGHARGPCIHCLRHRFVLKAVRQLIAQGVETGDIAPYLSIYLGHKGIYETEMYMKFYADMFPGEIEKFESYAKSAMPDEAEWDCWMEQGGSR